MDVEEANRLVANDRKEKATEEVIDSIVNKGDFTGMSKKFEPDKEQKKHESTKEIKKLGDILPEF